MSFSPFLRQLLRPSLALGRVSTVRRDRRAAARTAVRTGVLAIAVAIFGLAAIVERDRPEWRDPEFFHRLQRLRRLDTRPSGSPAARPLVVVLGSSRPQLGFSPDHAARGYGDDPPLIHNLSQSGCQPVGLWLNARRMLDAHIVPDLLLVEILPVALDGAELPDIQIPMARLGVADLARAEPYFDDPERARRRWLGSKLAIWYDLRFNLLAHAGRADWNPASVRQDFLWTGMQPNGWMPFYPADWTDAARQRLLARSRGDFVARFGRFAIHPRIATVQRELMRDCRSRGIRVGLFLTPESPEFRSFHPPAALETIRKHIEELGREFDVPVFDARNWIDDDRAFMDGYHLLGPGAEAFSERFGAECLRPLLMHRP